MSSYIGHHAELYDIFYAEKNYKAEASFIHQCITKFGKNNAQTVLELACGTGNHAFQLEKFGYEITATDYSKDMLSEAAKKKILQKSQVTLVEADMRNLQFQAGSFDSIICLFDSIGYVQTNNDILKVLDNVKRILKKDGLFIFEFWHAGAMIKNYDSSRIKRWEINNKKILRISETAINYSTQLCSVKYTIGESNDGINFSFFSETQTNRFFLLQEMELFIESAGFKLIKYYDGFQEKEDFDENSWHIIAVVKNG